MAKLHEMGCSGRCIKMVRHTWAHSGAQLTAVLKLGNCHWRYCRELQRKLIPVEV